MLLKKRFIALAALCLCAMLSFACGGDEKKKSESSGSTTSTAGSGKNFHNLSFMGSYQTRHPTPVHYWIPIFFEEAKKDLGGRLTFNYFASNSLFPEKESFDAVSDGRVDFGTIRGSLFPGSMNLMGVLDIPGMAPNAIVGALTAQSVMDKFEEVRSEFPPNTVPYVVWTSAAYQLHTIKPVRNIEDLKGLKIIVWDAVTLEIIKSLGANPVRMTSADSYLALSKAMADGVLCPLAPVRSFKISEACKYHTMLNIGVNSFNMFVYKPLWDEFPPDIKDWLIAHGGMNMALEVGKSLEDGQKVDIKWMQEQGHEFFFLTDTERGKFIDRLTHFKEDWVKGCKARGFKQVDEILSFTEERARHFTDEMRKGTYGDYPM